MKSQLILADCLSSLHRFDGIDSNYVTIESFEHPESSPEVFCKLLTAFFYVLVSADFFIRYVHNDILKWFILFGIGVLRQVLGHD